MISTSMETKGRVRSGKEVLAYTVRTRNLSDSQETRGKSRTHLLWLGYPRFLSRELSRAGGTKGSTTAETRHDVATKRDVRVLA